jgi:subtilase family serine protease
VSNRKWWLGSIVAAAAMPATALFGAAPAISPAAVTPAASAPADSGYAFQAGTQAPPGEFRGQSRVFDPQSMEASYNLNSLYDSGTNGLGKTVAIVDSFGYPQVAQDLETFSQGYGLPLMCGMPGVACLAGMPTFNVLQFGNHQVKPSPASANSNPFGPGQEASNAWAGEVALDTQWVHAIAPMANILLVVTPTAETLGVQGFPNMMNAEQYVVDHHLADVVTQSFGAAEDSFSNYSVIQNLRHAFISGTQAGITFMAASGDNGSTGLAKPPVGHGNSLLPNPEVGWPASDPLVTGVGGTNLCTDPVNGSLTADDSGPPAVCTSNAGQREVAWNGSGGGFSRVFSKPGYQDAVPATQIGSMRGVPDVSWDASCQTYVWVRISAPGVTPGFYGICGTSAASPQFAGMVALADQLGGRDLGLINPTLYSLASGSNASSYFFDVTTGNNIVAGTGIPGYNATTGWDPVTGVGTPNAANLVPALAAAGPDTNPQP